MNNFRILSRKTHNFFKKIFNNLRFRIESFNFAKIVVLTGVIISIISLFLKHIKSDNPIYNLNIFNKITIFSSYIAIIAYIIILFLLFSFNKKETFKKSSFILFRDYIIIFFLAIILFFLALNNIFTINALKMFSSEIYLGNGALMFLFSFIIIIIGTILLKNEYSHQQIVLNDSIQENKENKQNKNTKLPF